jgi:drug/metabolite transporter (DMT)-like permease
VTRDEQLTSRRAAGVLLGLSGVVLMIGPDSLGGLGRDVLAQLAVLLAGISYACAGIFDRRFTSIPPLVTATGQVTASTRFAPDPDSLAQGRIPGILSRIRYSPVWAVR